MRFIDSLMKEDLGRNVQSIGFLCRDLLESRDRARIVYKNMLRVFEGNIFLKTSFRRILVGIFTIFSGIANLAQSDIGTVAQISVARFVSH